MSASPFKLESVPGGMRFNFDVRVAKTERQRKEAHFDTFTIPCDEGEAIGGDNTAPPPLAYFASALGF
jgi:hypothetical protein